MKLLTWLKTSFEDDNGNASYRRLTAFVFVCIDAFIILFGKITTPVMLNVHYSLLTFILLLTGIITTQNILQFFNKK